MTFNSTHPPMIMGILNVTPDSFSDGGQYNSPDRALERAVEMIAQGADIIDIGGESTRPGAESVATQEQIDRIAPVIHAIRSELGDEILISVDTTDYEVAKYALLNGSNWINDISAGEDAGIFTGESEPMLALAAKQNAPIVLMHRQGVSATMQHAPFYEDVCREVTSYLKNRAQQALQAGVKHHNIILDPGIGFGKLLEHNLKLLAHLDELVALGYPVLLGTSRKRFIGEINGLDIPEERMAGTCATTALGVQAGVQIFRVHDISENRQAADVAWRIKNAR